MKILVASNNQGKIQEIQEILQQHEIISLKQINCNIEVIEDGKTFEENAIKKAKTIFQETQIPSIADDSGIEIEEYQGWPGVLTARFLGEDKQTNEYARERNKYILEKMKNLQKEKRKVKHVTCIAYCDKNGAKVSRGEQAGYISQTPRGDNGFGFDEIFELPNGKTMAEITKEEKNQISSRKKALEKIKKQICNYSQPLM